MQDAPYERIHLHLSETLGALSDYTEQYPDEKALIEIARLLTEAQQRVLQLEKRATTAGREFSP
jgi:hypothetical protein